MTSPQWLEFEPSNNHSGMISEGGWSEAGRARSVDGGGPAAEHRSYPVEESDGAG